MSGRSGRRVVREWVYVSAGLAPVGGGLVKLWRGSTGAAVVVGVAPYAVLALVLGVLAVICLAALIGCRGKGQDAMVGLMREWVNAVVAVLTLTPGEAPPGKGPSG